MMPSSQTSAVATSERVLRIALAQYALCQDMSANLTRALELMQEASSRDAHLIMFPELCLSPFFPQFSGLDVTRYVLSSESEPIVAFQDACRRLRMTASPNVYLQEAGRRFDASLLIGPQGHIHGISKMVHIAQVPCFYEQDYYAPSDTGFKVYETPAGKVGIVVCFDRHYPESMRTCVLRGAELIIIPTANTTDEPLDLFECELRAAALQNGVYIAMCNRVGTEGQVVFCGESMVVDPFGNVIAKAGRDDALLTADIDLSQVERARSHRPYLSLRRPESYER